MLGDALQGTEPDRDDWRRYRLMEAENSRLRAALEKAAILAETYWREVEATKEAHHRYTDAPFRYEDFSYDPDRAIRSKLLGQAIRQIAQG